MRLSLRFLVDHPVLEDLTRRTRSQSIHQGLPSSIPRHLFLAFRQPMDWTMSMSSFARSAMLLTRLVRREGLWSSYAAVMLYPLISSKFIYDIAVALVAGPYIWRDCGDV